MERNYFPSTFALFTTTNRDLQSAVNEGKFRQDLFYRLNVFPIQSPAVRERRDDIPLLAGYPIERFASRSGKKIQQIAKRTGLRPNFSRPIHMRRVPSSAVPKQRIVSNSVALMDIV